MTLLSRSSERDGKQRGELVEGQERREETEKWLAPLRPTTSDAITTLTLTNSEPEPQAESSPRGLSSFEENNTLAIVVWVKD